MTNSDTKKEGSKVWFITGSSRGLGRALLDEVLAAGHRVVATARKPEDLDKVVRAHGDRVKAVRLDVTDPGEAARAVEEAIAAFGRIDVLVNNAGYGNTDSAEDLPLDDFRPQIDTNFWGVVHVTRAALPAMRARRRGRILQIRSIGGRRGGTPGLAAYQAAKFAVAGFIEVLINEARPLGIQATIVEPGGFATDWAGSSMKVYPSSPDYDGTVGETARRLRGNPQSVARAVPAKAAKVSIALAEMDQQPRRLLLGSDAYVLAHAAAHELLASDNANRALSAGTDADGLCSSAEGAAGVGRSIFALGCVSACTASSRLIDTRHPRGDCRSGRRQLRMPEKLLDRTDVRAALEHQGRARVSKQMARARLAQLRLPHIPGHPIRQAVAPESLAIQGQKKHPCIRQCAASQARAAVTTRPAWARFAARGSSASGRQSRPLAARAHVHSRMRRSHTSGMRRPWYRPITRYSVSSST